MCNEKTNDYLVVSRTKKDAAYLYRYFRGYICHLDYVCVHIQNKELTVIIDSVGFHGKIRFISDREYNDASLGFHGWMLNGYDLERWLDAAYEYEREES